VPPERVTVVIPTYNERENLTDITSAVAKLGYQVLIVDDGSPDGTGEIAERIAEENPQVGVLHRAEKQGLGPAYAEGFDRSLQAGAEIIVEMDADFSHDPNDLPRLVAAVTSGADLAIGSRYVKGGSTPDWPLARRLISRGGNLYARLLLGIPVRDATAGFRAFRAEALSCLPYDSAEASGYGFQVEMAWRAVEAGMKVVEIPISFHDRTRGSSKMGPGIVLEAMGLVTLWGLARLWDSVRFWDR
jgi:dolichol-phosphate mannosyltransferase